MSKEYKYVYMVIISCITFIFGVAITTYTVTHGPGGTAKIHVGDAYFEIKVNDVNFKELFDNPKYIETAKAMAMRSFNLYEIGPKLIEAIRNTDYNDAFSRSLREMGEHMVGPFNAPDKKVVVIFSNNIDRDKAEVCPDSDFYKKGLNIALSDLSSMTYIHDAGLTMIHGCPPKEGEMERVVISEEQGRTLLNIKEDNLPSRIDAIVKPILSHRVVENRHRKEEQL